jgi:hypothetical protein
VRRFQAQRRPCGKGGLNSCQAENAACGSGEAGVSPATRRWRLPALSAASEDGDYPIYAPRRRTPPTGPASPRSRPARTRSSCGPGPARDAASPPRRTSGPGAPTG